MDNDDKAARWFNELAEALNFVESIWCAGEPETELHATACESTRDVYSLHEFYPDIAAERALRRARVSEPPREWLIGLTPLFQDAIKNIDKRLQGRVLEAIAEISRQPLQPRGDTVKPLDGEWKGAWRYRIGDWRLIYRPEAKDGQLWLLDFKPRGGAYG